MIFMILSSALCERDCRHPSHLSFLLGLGIQRLVWFSRFGCISRFKLEVSGNNTDWSDIIHLVGLLVCSSVFPFTRFSPYRSSPIWWRNATRTSDCFSDTMFDIRCFLLYSFQLGSVYQGCKGSAVCKGAERRA